MKTTIRIQNFKSLEDVTLELAPTTVFLGPNGAGKSSVLKCLEFVSKNLENINSQKPTETNYKLSNNVDLGSFEEVVLNNDIKNDIVFEFKHNSKITKEFKRLGLTPSGTSINDIRVMEVYLTKEDDETKKAEKISKLKSSLLQEWLGNDYSQSFSMGARSELEMLNFDSHERLDFVSKYFSIFNFQLNIRFTYSGNKYNLKNLQLIELNSRANILIETNFNSSNKANLSAKVNFKSASSIFNQIINNSFVWNFKDSWRNYNQAAKELILWHAQEYSNKYTLDSKISDQEHLLLKTISGLIILFEIFPDLLKKFLNIEHLPSVRQIPPHQQKLSGKKNRNKTILADFHFLRSYQELQAILLADKVETIQKSLPKDEKISSEHLTLDEKDFLKNNKKLFIKYYRKIDEYFLLINLINSLRSLKLAKNIYIKKEKTNAKVMVETLSGAHINFSDSSSGLIQLYPILAAITFSLFWRLTEFIYIEQPELHLHPKLQSRVAEICSNTQDTDNERVYWQTKFIIETHSEHLIRGYQLLIAKGKIKPQHIRFYYFNPVDNKTEVINLKVDKLGNFITPWPNGFFEEASDLSYKLLEEQLKRQK